MSIAEQFSVLAELQEEGLIRHLGLSGVSDTQLTEALTIAPVVTVQNLYNPGQPPGRRARGSLRRGEHRLRALLPARRLHAVAVRDADKVATRVNASAQQVALAWLLQRSSTIVLIPGTSSVEHLRENVAAADLVLPEDAVAELDTIGR